MIIFVTENFEALHRWKDAPEETSFLRRLHRHLFKVRLEIEVFTNDRELEFFAVKKQLKRAIKVSINLKDAGSCEQIAIKLLNYLHPFYKGRKMACEVSEDGENGAVVVMGSSGSIF